VENPGKREIFEKTDLKEAGKERGKGRNPSSRRGRYRRLEPTFLLRYRGKKSKKHGWENWEKQKSKREKRKVWDGQK